MRYLPELLALPLLPVLLRQGRRVRRTALRLPEPADANFGLAHADSLSTVSAPLRLVVLGESPVAGVGLASHEQGIAASTARELARRLKRPVRWSAHGKNGASVSDALTCLLPTLGDEGADLVCVAFGVNDSTAFCSTARFRRDMQQLIDTLRERLHPALIVLSGVPPLQHFPLLPTPLAQVLGLKARALDAELRKLACEPGLLHLPLPTGLSDPRWMAEDGFHPSAAGCAFWGEQLAQTLATRFA